MDQTSLQEPVMLSPACLKIALCVPEFQPFHQVMRGVMADATYIIQKYISTLLQAHGHELTFVAPLNLSETVCTRDPMERELAQRTWTKSRWFGFTSKSAWQVQKWLGLPYLNYFSNYRTFDACLHCLPGHDLVYERNSLYRFGVAMACKRLRVPYVLFFEADDILEHDIMGRPITGLLRWRASEALRYNLKTAGCIICVSEPGKMRLVNAWGVPEDKIVVFPNAADVQRFRPDPEARVERRVSLEAGDNPLIIFVGNFYEWHDIETLLRAFADITWVYPEARLILVGDGAKRSAMMQLAADLEISRAVQFIGSVAHDEVPGLLNAADIAVAPYPSMKDEMWLSPMKLFEYLASGTAVIASAVGQVSAVIKDGYNGLLVQPGDIPGMKAALGRLLEDPVLRSQLGWHAREDAVQNYSWERYVARLERVYDAVITGKPVSNI
jgi:glycosyltransferase involved in cell wall biosynthesis